MRGILVAANYAGGDSRDSYSEPWYTEFMQLRDFAFVGTRGFNSHAVNVGVLERALEHLAGVTGHPELVNARFATPGFPAGGGFASRLLVEVPERVIASVVVGSRLNFTGMAPSAANLGTPASIINGDHEDNGMAVVVEPVLAQYRPQGPLFGWMAVQGKGHEMCGQQVLAMPFLDAAVHLRYPADADVRKGPVELKPLAPSSGWAADNTTWRNGLTTIAPASEFTGDITRSSWLPTQDVAFIYRAYATYAPHSLSRNPPQARVATASTATGLAWKL